MNGCHCCVSPFFCCVIAQLFTSTGGVVNDCYDLDVVSQQKLAIKQFTPAPPSPSPLSREDMTSEDMTSQDMSSRSSLLSEDTFCGHMFVVPPGRLFLWPTFQLGEKQYNLLKLVQGNEWIVIPYLSSSRLSQATGLLPATLNCLTDTNLLS